MKGIKISIIIPCYNVEKYLSRCLESILNQKVAHDLYEIITVIDGSKDNSESICSKYASIYSNIKVVVKENGGVYAARNTGVEEAGGEYIWFVDPDDYVTPNSLSDILLALSTSDLDVLFFYFNRVDEAGHIMTNIKDNFKTEKNQDVLSGKDFLDKIMLYSTFLWGFVAKSKIIKGMKFKENMRSMGDAEYIPRMLLTTNRVKIDLFTAYNYVCREGSISKLKKPSVNLLNGAYEALKTNLLMQKSHPDVAYFSQFSSYLILTNIRLLSQSNDEKLTKRFFFLIKSEKVSHIIYQGKDYKRKLMVLLYNISPLACFNISKLFKRQ